MVMLGMLLAGVSPLMAFEGKTGGTTKGSGSSGTTDALTLDSLEKASLTNTLGTIGDATKTTGNTAITIILWGAMAMGVGFFFWGAYMAASKDQREEGKAKDGIKLAGLGIIFIAAVSVIKSIIGVS